MSNLPLAVAAFLLALGSQPPAGADVPKDFAIRFEFGMCWRDVADTARDRYVRDLATGNGATRTVRLGLSAAQRRQLSAWVDESRFFDLPGEMNAAVPKDGLVTSRI